MLILGAALCAAAAGSDDEKQIVSVVQKLFDAMAANDAEALSSTMTPDALILLVRDDRILPAMSRDEFVKRATQNKARVVERTWDPKVLVRGRIAMFWAEYDLHAGGIFNHCGIDTFLLLKTDSGWKIFNGESTAETQGCKPSPLGPLPDK